MCRVSHNILQDCPNLLDWLFQQYPLCATLTLVREEVALNRFLLLPKKRDANEILIYCEGEGCTGKITLQKDGDDNIAELIKQQIPRALTVKYIITIHPTGMGEATIYYFAQTNVWGKIEGAKNEQSRSSSHTD